MASVCTADTVIVAPAGETCSRRADFTQPVVTVRLKVNADPKA